MATCEQAGPCAVAALGRFVCIASRVNWRYRQVHSGLPLIAYALMASLPKQVPALLSYRPDQLQAFRPRCSFADWPPSCWCPPHHEIRAWRQCPWSLSFQRLRPCSAWGRPARRPWRRLPCPRQAPSAQPSLPPAWRPWRRAPPRPSLHSRPPAQPARKMCGFVIRHDGHGSLLSPSCAQLVTHRFGRDVHRSTTVNWHPSRQATQNIMVHVCRGLAQSAYLALLLFCRLCLRILVDLDHLLPSLLLRRGQLRTCT